LTHGRSVDQEWERSKLSKDYADIFSLLDTEATPGNIDYSVLGKAFDDFEFLRGHFDELPEQRASLELYGRMSHGTLKSICDKIVLSTK